VSYHISPTHQKIFANLRTEDAEIEASRQRRHRLTANYQHAEND
jgi:hypothetical protein